ncbi:MAG: SUMF1/EgtB/PvdO family nonheme iron enzyme [Hyphomicrobium zavarzinii]|jgi:formylglycine-generating enzyme required for sulfatase activity|uniref:SUMF1/EgtB/PvdO family nonheme iron enzyme n=1 Tax=Hyphomicrobium zavarzinii TaxID=48292 RepID=UPI001A631E4A|nr:SUMF1/EgtB/PvdO family nonheme iron enzyme [Hyphomicrobium zavarzinii]MBL8845190.1 SUMF1/EgtB/PvdO family nonheme iron enzyme [Hyphomicrobium zavarzinii]
MVMDVANVRAEPSTASEIVTQLKPGSYITVEEQSTDGSWSYISFAGDSIGWVYNPVLLRTTTPAGGAAAANDTVRLDASAAGPPAKDVLFLLTGLPGAPYQDERAGSDGMGGFRTVETRKYDYKVLAPCQYELATAYTYRERDYTNQWKEKAWVTKYRIDLTKLTAISAKADVEPEDAIIGLRNPRRITLVSYIGEGAVCTIKDDGTLGQCSTDQPGTLYSFDPTLAPPAKLHSTLGSIQKHCPAGSTTLAQKLPADAPKPGTAFRDCPQCPEVVVVPAGSFLMGSPPDEQGRAQNEGPQRSVTIAKPFAVGKFEVTFEEWDACVAVGGCSRSPADRGWGRYRRPVINITWLEAKQYITWLSAKTGKRYRLLSEAEWEYAARAGTTTPFSTGWSIGHHQANYARGYNQFTGTVDVGSYPPNTFGLHDMHGNVMEWVEDCYGPPSDKQAQPSGDCKYRVCRDGAWTDDNPARLGSARRAQCIAGEGSSVKGFRVARSL